LPLLSLSLELSVWNVLGRGSRFIAPVYAEEIVDVWLSTPFAKGRHVPRI